MNPSRSLIEDMAGRLPRSTDAPTAGQGNIDGLQGQKENFRLVGIADPNPYPSTADSSVEVRVAGLCTCV